MKHLYLIALSLVFLLPSCASVPRLLENGRFEKAYAVALQRCTRGRAPTIKQADQYLDAYAAVQARDFAIARETTRKPGTAKYESLYHRYADLHRRSLDILDVAPAAARFDRYPELAPASLEAQRENARRKAGAHYLTRIAPLLPDARRGNKLNARKAWLLHQKVAFFLPERDAEFTPLRDSLFDTGTLRILLYVPDGEFARELDDVTARLKPYHKNWTEVIVNDYGARIDLEAELTYDNYSGGNFSENCSTSDYSEEVLDYIEKKKVKERINDSTVVEKIVEIKHYKKVYAEVTRCDQSVSVSAYGNLNVYRPGGRAAEWRTRVYGGDSWSNSYSYGSGDRRALPAFANSGRPGNPPPLGVMLARAVCGMPYGARRALVKRYKIDDR